MLTSYTVKCPMKGCSWFGSLMPRDLEASWFGVTPNEKEVVFECPKCHGEWHGRLHGDDVEMLTTRTRAKVA